MEKPKSIKIAEDIHHALDMFSTEEKKTLQKLVDEILRAGLERLKTERQKSLSKTASK